MPKHQRRQHDDRGEEIAESARQFCAEAADETAHLVVFDDLDGVLGGCDLCLAHSQNPTLRPPLTAKRAGHRVLDK